MSKNYTILIRNNNTKEAYRYDCDSCDFTFEQAESRSILGSPRGEKYRRNFIDESRLSLKAAHNCQFSTMQDSTEDYYKTGDYQELKNEYCIRPFLQESIF